MYAPTVPSNQNASVFNHRRSFFFFFFFFFSRYYTQATTKRSSSLDGPPAPPHGRITPFGPIRKDWSVPCGGRAQHQKVSHGFLTRNCGRPVWVRPSSSFLLLPFLSHLSHFLFSPDIPVSFPFFLLLDSIGRVLSTFPSPWWR